MDNVKVVDRILEDGSLIVHNEDGTRGPELINPKDFENKDLLWCKGGVDRIVETKTSEEEGKGNNKEKGEGQPTTSEPEAKSDVPSKDNIPESSLSKDIESRGNVTLDGDNIVIRSENIDEQIKENTSEGKEVTASNTFSEDVDVINSTAQKSSEFKDNVLSGNPMYEYEQATLKDDGILKRRVGGEPNDSMNTYFSWMEAAGIKLQNIIDREVAAILKSNPHAKIKFMATNMQDNATHDDHMRTHCLLVMDYDNSINKNITSIHDPNNGGVIESHGKKYLVVGVMGYGSKYNTTKKAWFDAVWSNSKSDLGLMKQGMREYFKQHPGERFYVNDTFTTEIVPYSLIPGWRVRQMQQDETPQHRTISEILADKERNPYGYTLDEVVWGIQEKTQFMIIGKPDGIPMVPRNPALNQGRVFALIPASNGNLMPAYMKVLKYQEMKDGALKQEVNDLLNKVVSLEEGVNGRYEAALGLCNIFYLDPNENAIIPRMTRDAITLVVNGKDIEFTLDANFDRNKFLETFWEMNPIVNITGNVLKHTDLIKKYEEAGALTTDLAMFGTAGSYYDIYPVDKEGKMVVPNNPQGNIPNTSDTDYRNTGRTQLPYGHQWYREAGGTYYLGGKAITDPNIIKQLDYNKRLLDGNFIPAKSEGVWNYYILKEGEHPEVVKHNRNNQEVREVPEEQAKKIIEEFNKKMSETAKEEEASKAVKEAEKNIKMDKGQEIDLTGENLTIDPNTGETVQQGENQPAEVDNTESPTKEDDSHSKKIPENPEIKQRDVKHSNLAGNIRKSTQSFTELMRNSKYSFRILNIAKTKWKDAPKKFSELEVFLRGKDMNVDNIGTSEKDIESWIDTLKNCR